MESRVQEAVKRKIEGYNCAQAVLCTYADVAGMDEQTAYKVSEAFGTGMGGMQHTCGAASAAFMLVGLVNSDGVLGSKQTRSDTYAMVRTMAKEFEETNAHLMCHDIILDVDDTGKRKHPCVDCVACGAQLIEKYLVKK